MMTILLALEDKNMTSKSEPAATVSPSKKSVAWAPFQKKLAGALAKLEEDQFLIVALKHSRRFVQFAAQGAFGMRAETTSNHYLTKQEQLDAKQLLALKTLGWVDPTGTHQESTPEADPDGSSNFYCEFASPVSFERVAELAIKTLTEVIRTPHPGSLEYSAFDTQGNQIDVPELGLRRTVSAATPNGSEVLSAKLLATMQDESGISELAIDSDGDILTRYGSALIFGQLFGDPIYVRFYSPLLREVEECAELFERLNDMNVNERSMRLMYQNGVIFAVAETAGVPFVSAHVVQTYQRFCVVVDGLDSLVQEEFGGLTAFPEPVPAHALH